MMRRIGPVEHIGGTLYPSVGVKQVFWEDLILELRCEGSEKVTQRKWGRAKGVSKEKNLVKEAASAKDPK